MPSEAEAAQEGACTHAHTHYTQALYTHNTLHALRGFPFIYYAREARSPQQAGWAPGARGLGGRTDGRTGCRDTWRRSHHRSRPRRHTAPRRAAFLPHRLGEWSPLLDGSSGVERSFPK